MPSAQSQITTPNAAAYLARLCGHLAKVSTHSRLAGHRPGRHAGGGPPFAVLHAEQAPGTGTITISWGTLSLRAADDLLTIRADARSPEDLRRIQDMTTDRLLKFGRREPLDIRWTPVTGTPGEQQAT